MSSAHALPPPDWSHERRLRARGYACVAGLDEVGRGSLAGPVVVAAVVLRGGRRLAGVHDSKLLTATTRERLVGDILACAESWGIGSVEAEEIDRINIANATRKAMMRALAALRVHPDHLLIDAVALPEAGVPQTVLIGGDRLSKSIASASILAKVVRDEIMTNYDRLFPQYGFARHKGYGTAGHLRVLQDLGACAQHRKTFGGVRPQRRLDLSDDRRSPWL
ncbi:MAG TPA: ribonuclease HII [Candidatus Polarisedimenticolia bacterium]|nr:ribonuclease HII [Candidatus Polarisedimenticolia bacterium]